MRGKAWAAGVVAFALTIGACLVAPKFALWMSRASGAEWDAARDELSKSYRAELADPAFPFALEPAVKEALIKCQTDKAIELLNKTTCEYQYIVGSKSQGEHLAAQDACLAAAGHPAKMQEAVIACIKQVVPPDWAIMRPGFRAAFKQTLMGAAVSDPDKAAACMADKAVALFIEAKCPFYNEAATSAEDVVNSPDLCIEKAGLTSRLTSVGEECMAL